MEQQPHCACDETKQKQTNSCHIQIDIDNAFSCMI